MFSLTGKDQKAKIKKGGDYDLRNVPSWREEEIGRPSAIGVKEVRPSSNANDFPFFSEIRD